LFTLSFRGVFVPLILDQIISREFIEGAWKDPWPLLQQVNTQVQFYQVAIAIASPENMYNPRKQGQGWQATSKTTLSCSYNFSSDSLW